MSENSLLYLQNANTFLSFYLFIIIGLDGVSVNLLEPIKWEMVTRTV